MTFEKDYWHIVKNSLNSVIMFWPKVMDVLEVLFDVIDMATWYGGTAFYEYHKEFSARAAAYRKHHNIPIDLSKSCLLTLWQN